MSAASSVSAGINSARQSAVDWRKITGSLIGAVVYPLAGIAVMIALWWLGGVIVAADPDTAAFADFSPAPAFSRLIELAGNGYVLEASIPSLGRIGYGLLCAIAFGVPLGVIIGLFSIARQVSNLPFQFLRMISPLAWMPIAVLAFETWNGAIVFLVAVAAIWPILFSTAQGVRRIDPFWFKVAKNLGADGLQMLRRIILPAIGQDIFAGIRLAVGVAWVVLVPAEYLGVTSGLGYAINDARDTLEYDTLAAMVVVIGVIGFFLDGICVSLIKRFSWHHE